MRLKGIQTAWEGSLLRLGGSYRLSGTSEVSTSSDSVSYKNCFTWKLSHLQPKQEVSNIQINLKNNNNVQKKANLKYLKVIGNGSPSESTELGFLEPKLIFKTQVNYFHILFSCTMILFLSYTPPGLAMQRYPKQKENVDHLGSLRDFK